MANKTVTIRVDKTLLSEIDDKWKEMGFNNRSEYIKYKLKEGMNHIDLKNKIKRLREDGTEMIEEGNKKLKEADYLESELENGFGDVYEIKDELVDMIIAKYRKWGGRVYYDEKFPFVITEIPNNFDDGFDWVDEDEAARVMEINKPEVDMPKTWKKHAEQTVNDWIDKNLIIYGKNG